MCASGDDGDGVSNGGRWWEITVKMKAGASSINDSDRTISECM